MIPSGVIIAMLCGCLFAGLMSDRANHWQPAAIYSGLLVFVILAWSAVALVVFGVQQLLQQVFS